MAGYTSAIPVFMGGGAGPFSGSIPVVLVDSSGNPISGTNPLGISRLTNAAASGVIDIAVSGAITTTIPANTASANLIQDSSLNAYWLTDTRTTVNNISAHLLNAAPPTLPTAGLTAYHLVSQASPVITLTGSTAIANLVGIGSFFQTPTITNASVDTITTASTIAIQGAPVALGSQIITNPLALQLSGGVYLTGTLANLQGAVANCVLYSDAIMTAANAGHFALAAQTFSAGTWTQDIVGYKFVPTLTAGGAPSAANRFGAFIHGGTTLPGGAGAWTMAGNYHSFAHDAQTIAGIITGNYCGYLTSGPTITGTITGGGAYGYWADSTWATTTGTTNINPLRIDGGQSAFTPTVGSSGAPVAASANLAWSGIHVLPATIFLTGATAINAALGISLVTLRTPTINSATAGLVISNVATLTIQGAPTLAGSNPATATNLDALRIVAGTLALGAKIRLYNNVATLGWGTPAVYGYVRPAQQVNTTVTLATYTVGAADGSFVVSANINVTVATASLIGCTCTYTDETNVSRALVLNFSNIAGVFATTTTLNTAGAFEGVPLHIRAKAATTITLATTGTVTTATYTAEAQITQVA